MKWYLRAFKYWRDFSGRARRKEYWMFQLVNFFVSFALAATIRGFHLPRPLMHLYSWVIFIPSLALSIRRLHDTNHNFWYGFIPVYNIVLMIRKGTPGVNEYGPDPKLIEGETDHLNRRRA